jgi:hypothetical protein
MNVYTTEEIERINKIRDVNNKLEDFFSDRRNTWNKDLSPLYEIIRLDFSRETSSKITESQALCLSYRQIINDEISVYLTKRSKQDAKLKRIKQDKFIWYATGFGVKTNTGEKTLLIEAHVAEEQRNIELIESYIEFLRQTVKNLESYQWTIKNIIELNNYLK